MIVLGLMSGTSLDGLDMALCEFTETRNTYSFKILQNKTFDYNQQWKTRLSNIKNADAEQYFMLHAAYGKYMAGEINEFLSTSAIRPMAIASHGHTVFHQPALGFSTQIGCGATIAANTGIITVCDFRSLDVAHGGQGAPLVPIGDQLLFSDYSACLNIGGIANISFNDNQNNRLAYDICEANMLLNYLAEKTGKSFDDNGQLARSGKTDADLLQQLNAQAFYQQTGAKSLGREWFEKNILPIVDSNGLPINDILATATEHVAKVIAATLNDRKIKNILITGGGAFNGFLIKKIRSETNCEIIIPSTEIINFKEALIFAFLGYLRLQMKTNTLISVTGAKQNSIGGAVYLA